MNDMRRRDAWMALFTLAAASAVGAVMALVGLKPVVMAAGASAMFVPLGVRIVYGDRLRLSAQVSYWAISLASWVVIAVVTAHAHPAHPNAAGAWNSGTHLDWRPRIQPIH